MFHLAPRHERRVGRDEDGLSFAVLDDLLLLLHWLKLWKVSMSSRSERRLSRSYSPQSG